MRTTAPPANKEETTTDQTKSRGLDGDVATYLPVYRFSGHQSFPLRSSWLPKAIREITDGKDPLNHVDAGIVSLGLGKNMVHALRCWIEAFQVAVFTPTGWKLSPVGNLVLSPGGLDPHL
jgi:hypothetical protein